MQSATRRTDIGTALALPSGVLQEIWILYRDNALHELRW
jgi:hypothetical protein